MTDPGRGRRGGSWGGWRGWYEQIVGGRGTRDHVGLCHAGVQINISKETMVVLLLGEQMMNTVK